MLINHAGKKEPRMLTDGAKRYPFHGATTVRLGVRRASRRDPCSRASDSAPGLSPSTPEDLTRQRSGAASSIGSWLEALRGTRHGQRLDPGYEDTIEGEPT